jgi:cell division septal protein FtsQ
MSSVLRNRALISAALIFSLLVYLFAWSPVFQVQDVMVSGLPTQVQESEIIAIAKIANGEKLARIQPRGISNRLSEIKWIKHSSISRNWISGEVLIQIQPRVPVGIFQGKAVDAEGEVFAYPGVLDSNLPLVSASSPDLGLTAIALFKTLPQEIRQDLISLSAFNESSISSWQKMGDRQIKVQWGSMSQIPLKVKVYKALVALPENSNIKRVDLSAPHAPIVK